MPRPSRANGAALPAACAAVLGGCVALQLVLTSPAEPPPLDRLGRAASGALPGLSVALAEPVLRSSTIFSPTRTGGPSAPSGAAATPLGGVVVAGSVSVRGQVRAIVQLPDGRVRHLPLGGQVNGLRLIALTPGGATFAANGQRLSVPFGATAVAAPPPAETEEQPE